MANLAFDTVSTDWVDASTLATFTSDSSYFIQNRGAGILVAVEDSTEPSDDSGTAVLPYKVFKYTAGTDKLWLKALTGTCAVNISEA